MSTQAPSAAPAPRKLSLGVIFLTLYIDLVGFSIIFPLGPDLIAHYLQADGGSGILGWLHSHTVAVARALGNEADLAAVLFGGVLSSFFSILQFICAPLWGGLSDKRGRRGVLLLTVAGNAFAYLLWALSGSFWLFLVSRIVSGAFSGNLSVATAAVADVTSREERSKAMGLVGAAFGLGLVTGPAIGGFTAHLDLTKHFPALTSLGLNPFSVPALVSFVLCVVNFFWIRARFAETLPDAVRAGAAEARVRRPLHDLLSLDNAPVRRTNLVAFVYSVAFVGMEATLTFLAAQRFGYNSRQNAMLLVFLGLCSVVMQGVIVRRILKKVSEVKVLSSGLVFSSLGLLGIGFAPTPALLYGGLLFLAIGSGLVNPASTGLISLYSSANEQGRVLGIFRSLGALARAVTPICAGVLAWLLTFRSVYVAGAALALTAAALSLALPRPQK